MNFLRKALSVAAFSAALCSSLSFGSCDLFESDLPELNIDWQTITENLESDESKTALSTLGWYADTGEIEEFGTITFYNYDFKKPTSFKAAPYQFYIEYGCIYYLDENGEAVYYDHPAYEIMLVDNASEDYYSCTYDDDLAFLSEEGSWFLSEDKADYIADCLTACKDFVDVE